MDPTNHQVPELLEAYLDTLLDGDVPTASELVSIVRNCWELHEEVATDLIYAAIGAAESEPGSIEQRFLSYSYQSDHLPPSTINLDLTPTAPKFVVDLLKSSSSTPTPTPSPSLALFAAIVGALALHNLLRDPIPTFSFLAQCDDSGSLVLVLASRLAPTASNDVASLCVAVGILALANAESTAVPEAAKQYAQSICQQYSIRLDFSVADEKIVRFLALKTLHSLNPSHQLNPTLRIFLESLRQPSQAPHPKVDIADLIGRLDLVSISTLVAHLDSLPLADRLQSMYPHWPQIAQTLASPAFDEYLIRLVLHALATSLQMSPASLTHALRQYLYPASLSSRHLQCALEHLAGKPYAYLMADGLEYLLLDIVLHSDSDAQWTAQLEALVARKDIWRDGTTTVVSDVLTQYAMALAIQLALHRHDAGLAWVHSWGRKVTVVDCTLASLVHLTDALSPEVAHDGGAGTPETRWGPGRLTPTEALATLAWLVTYAGPADAKVCAVQAVTLALSVASQYPLEALRVWASVVSVVGQAEGELVMHQVWPFAVHAAAATLQVRGLLASEVAVIRDEARQLFNVMFSRVSREVLEETPDLPAEARELAEYQAHIHEAKAKLLREDRIEKMCARLGSPELVVARAAVKELAALVDQGLMGPQAGEPGGGLELDSGEFVRTLVNVAEHHAELMGEVIACLGKLGAMEIESVGSDIQAMVDGGATKEGIDRPARRFAFMPDAVSQDLVQLCLVLLQTALIPFFRSTSSMLSQTMFAYAIQKILKQFKKPCLDGLDDVDCATVRPLLESKYRVDVDALVAMPFDPPRPMYQPGMEFAEWACGLARVLARQVADRDLVLVIRAVLPLLIHVKHHPVATTLLPFIVLHLCLANTISALDLIAEEFLHVLHHAPLHVSAHPCALVVLNAVHHLSTWRRQERLRAIARTKLKESNSGGHLSGGTRRSTLDPKVGFIDSFLERLPPGMLATAAEHLGLTATAAFYLETAGQDGAPGAAAVPRNELGIRLVSVFKQLNASGHDDYVLGAAQLIRSEDRTAEMVALQHAVEGDWATVMAVYNGVLLTPSTAASVADQSTAAADLLVPHKGLYHAMKELGYFEALNEQIQGAVASHPDWAAELVDFQLDSLAKLGQWDSLEKIVDASEPITTPSIGPLYLDIRRGNDAKFQQHLRLLHSDTFRGLRLGHTNTALVRCHVLSDLAAFRDTISNWRQDTVHVEPTQVSHPVSRWLRQCQIRLARTPKQFKVREEMLSMMRSALELAKDLGHLPPMGVDGELRSLWLQSASLAMADGRAHFAYSCLLRGELPRRYQQQQQESQPQAADVCFVHERLMAKWLVANKSKQAALDRLMRLGLAVVSMGALSWNPVFDAQHSIQDPAFQRARLHLLMAQWMADTGSASAEGIVAQFKSACGLKPDWDKAYYFTGRFYHQLFKSTSHTSSLRTTYFKAALQFYARSLLVGNRFVHQALPQILTLWMDHAPPNKDDNSKAFVSIHNDIGKLIKHTPAYVLMTAIAQVTSRLTHTNEDVYRLLTAYLVRLLESYPGPTMWHLISSLMSADTARSRRTARVLADVSNIRQIKPLIDEMKKLASHLVDLSNLNLPKEVSAMSLLREPRCAALTTPRAFQNVILPIDSQLTSTLPPSPFAHSRTFDAFGSGSVTIHGFVDRVELMSSLVRPKKIVLIGSNGVEYVFLCKPKDDLRKDARLMEFTASINRLLQSSRAARDRQLHMRRYAVTPLNEECGLIEWVPHTVALRAIFKDRYQQRYHSLLYTREIAQAFNDKPEKLLGNFKNVLAQYPPVLQEWFVDTFPTPDAWFNARLRFTRTCAVVSMIGFVIGLGDRHLENILMHVKTGDAVHVDFNCLFDKGKTFGKPEVVPFRLTHNMVTAFGAVGIEGPFRRSCEVVLGVLRDHRESLNIVLETFVHDPLIEWKSKRKEKDRAKEESEEVMRRHARKLLQEIDNKLQGYVTPGGLPLGVSGQVNELIRQATSVENLSKMYEGWMPYL
ncbi:hypothetical protein BCR44DRAFT_1015824 [Catenaria anguillulae PL171]|uniref:Serine/threonine-protein kinase ATR n=1 Tax=Catenaria anguillulae PL171 TaxID=765915 RepID=A0A1Y2HTV1_9FUNG|nr:hypothetical protein BCR44DRAFT_1015824 [Catenaria anguillulae PL171]